MSEPTELTDISILPRTLGLADDVTDVRERRELLIFRRAERLFGIFADEADGVTQGLALTPLPRAPEAVLGITSVRGRMLTVLDPLALIAEKSGRRNDGKLSPPGFVVALRGDEQLALAVDRVERIVEIFTEEIAPLARGQRAEVMRGVVQQEALLIAVLDVRELFAAAMRGAERRRRRSND